MRIGFFGDGGWAHLALERLDALRAFEIAFVVARHQQPDEVLRDWASRLSIPFYAPPDVNANSFISEIERHGSEVNVSMSYDQILRKRIIELAPQGFINCHAGALPFYRGRNVLNWALINGEDHFGATVHVVDEGIDTGDIICQRFGRILPEDNYGTLLEKAERLCADTLVDALLSLKHGNVNATPQADIHPVGFYCSGRREGDEWINWHWPSERIHNFVRALTEPGPGARTLLNDEPVVVLQSELRDGAPAYIDRPGTVVGRTNTGIVVKTGDTSLLLKRIGDWENGTIQNKRVPRLSIGTMFGRSLLAEVEFLRKQVEALEKRLQ